VRDFSCHLRRSDGQIRLCELSARPLPIGGVDCMLTIARDITERHLMQKNCNWLPPCSKTPPKAC
jgi:periplasmic sensor diguanylate cyclase/phosphodiesterase